MTMGRPSHPGRPPLGRQLAFRAPSRLTPTGELPMRRINDEQNFARNGTLRTGGRTGQRSNRMRIGFTGSRRNCRFASGWAIRGRGRSPAVSGNAPGHQCVRFPGSRFPEQLPTPAVVAYTGPHFSSPSSAMTYMARTYNDRDVTALRAVTTPQSYRELMQMRSGAVNLRLRYHRRSRTWRLHLLLQARLPGQAAPVRSRCVRDADRSRAEPWLVPLRRPRLRLSYLDGL